MVKRSLQLRLGKLVRSSRPPLHLTTRHCISKEEIWFILCFGYCCLLESHGTTSQYVIELSGSHV